MVVVLVDFGGLFLLRYHIRYAVYRTSSLSLMNDLMLISILFILLLENLKK